MQNIDRMGVWWALQKASQACIDKAKTLAKIGAHEEANIEAAKAKGLIDAMNIVREFRRTPANQNGGKNEPAS